MSHRPASDIFLKESELINKSKRALDDGKEKNPIEKLRLLCLSRGATGILEMGRAFRRMDDDGSKALTLEEFTTGIQKSGIDCDSDAEIAQIFARFDSDGSGSIDMTEFLTALKPPMSQSRLSILEKAFEKLDKTGDGILDIEDMRNVYSAKSHPMYISGDLTRDEIREIFLSNFEKGGVLDGKVTKEEFFNYYSAVSASIDCDGYFDLMMRQCYQL